MSATPIAWNKDDIERLVKYPDYPWHFAKYVDVKPSNWYTNHDTGGDAPCMKASTEFTNIPEGFVPVSPVYSIDAKSSRVGSKQLGDNELVPFIYKDDRFSVVPNRTNDLTTNKPEGAVNAWGCQRGDKYQGIRMMRLKPSPDFCALGDQQLPSNFNPDKLCDVSWPKKNTNTYETQSFTTIYAVHRHLVDWTSGTPDKWLPEQYGKEWLHSEPLIRLNPQLALFRTDWLNQDGNYARPITLRNILKMSIGNDDSHIELADRAKLNKAQLSLSSTLENAVEMYRLHFCVSNPGADECACFRKLPNELNVPQYDVACHDTQCKTYGYKPPGMVEGKKCTELNLQVCTQLVNASGNIDSSLVANLKQECKQYIDKKEVGGKTDDTSTVVSKDGTKTITNADGSKIITKPDGTITTTDASKSGLENMRLSLATWGKASRANTVVFWGIILIVVVLVWVVALS